LQGLGDALPHLKIFGIAFLRSIAPVRIGQRQDGSHVARGGRMIQHCADQVSAAFHGHGAENLIARAPLATVEIRQAQQKFTGIAACQFEHAAADRRGKLLGTQHRAVVEASFA
jgi:hypothetical protein